MQDNTVNEKTIKCMSNRLSIYACSGVGAADDTYSYWTGGTLSQSNSQAVNNLLAKINLEYAKITNLALSDEEACRALDNIDLYSVCMYYAREYAENSYELHHVGQVISELVASGTFESNLLTDEERGAHLDELYDIVDKAMEGPFREDAVFMNWWRENVEDLNKVGLTKEQQVTVSRSLMGDVIGATDYGNADLNKYLNDAGEYFLYTYFTDAQLKSLPKAFQRKAAGQKRVYQYCRALYVDMNGTESSMKQIIRSGIVSTLKAQPEELCKDIFEKVKNGEGVGNPAAAVAMVGVLTVSEFIQVLIAVLTVVGSIIAAICSAVAQVKVAEVQTVDKSLIPTYTPSQDDYPNGWKKGMKGDNTLLIGAAIVALFLLLK